MIHVSQAICALIAGLVVICVLRAGRWRAATGAMVLVPLLLRIFLVK
jgi:hypothetical protein